MRYRIVSAWIIVFCVGYGLKSFSQFKPKEINWTQDGKGFLQVRNGDIVRTDMTSGDETVLVKREQLSPKGRSTPLNFNIYNFSSDNSKLLLFTNTAKVWRYNTRGGLLGVGYCHK